MRSWFHAPAATRGFQILVTVTYTTLFLVMASRDRRCNCNKKPQPFNSAGTSADKTVVEGGGRYTNLRDHNFSRYAAIEHRIYDRQNAIENAFILLHNVSSPFNISNFLDGYNLLWRYVIM